MKGTTKMADRELLELAARAGEITALRDPNGVLRNCTGFSYEANIFAAPPWNPLTDDGDALRLAVEFGMSLHVFPDHHQGAQAVATITRRAIEEREYAENNADDTCAATRRAIVRAAAALALSSQPAVDK
jgi:hypothetical protein